MGADAGDIHNQFLASPCFPSHQLSSPGLGTWGRVSQSRYLVLWGEYLGAGDISLRLLPCSPHTLPRMCTSMRNVH